jgi:thioredoxin 1
MENYVKIVTDENFNDFISTGLVLVDVYAAWCGPCKIIGPIVDQISIDFKGRLLVGKLDAETHRQTVGKLEVTGIPALFLYNDGELVEKMVGLVSKEKLTNIVNEYIM